MRSLFRISRRYVVTAVFIALFVLFANMAVVGFFLTHIAKGAEYVGMYREDMQEIEEEMSVSKSGCRLSEKGMEVLKDSACLWAMRLNQDGNVIWEYRLPEEIPRQYSIGDVAGFSRWYLKGYPVFVWKDGDELMVYGASKNLARFDMYGDIRVYGRLPDIFWLLILSNLLIITGLAMVFGVRFYRVLCPVVKGIEKLPDREMTVISEKGMAADLAKQLNRTSAILKKQDEQLAKRDQARTDWISGVSHDVRTPLALIMGLSDEIARASGVEDQYRKKAACIRENSRVIGDLVADLNLTVKLEYQSQPLKKENLSIAALLRTCIAKIYNQGISEVYQIVPVIDEESEKIKLDADPGLLSRAFRNLIGNSIRHNPAGCEATVYMKRETGRLQILFTDNGNGIPSEVLELLEGEKEKNSGIHIMGLRIVVQIVKAHGGSVRFPRRGDGRGDVMMEFPC